MKSKKQNPEGLAENLLINDLHKIIENGKNTLKRVASSELVTLFWNIGIELNNLLNKKSETQTEKNIIRIISENMATKYGPYFTEKSLNRMRQFADTFHDFIKLQKYVHFLSWEYVLVLLKLKKKDEREFYLALKIKQGLNLKELKKAIALNKYDSVINNHLNKERNNISNKKKQKNLQVPDMTFEFLVKNDRVKPNLFKKSNISIFRYLLEPTKQVQEISNNLIYHESIVQLVEDYRSRQNIWLNANFNLILWEVGKRLGQEILLTKPKDEINLIVKSVSAQFQRNSKVFSHKQLLLMLQFAERFPTLEAASQISYLVSWEHIVILFSLRDLNDFSFYIEVVIEKGLNANELKKLISQESTQHLPNAKQQSQKLLLKTKTYKKRTIITNTEQSNINITMVNFEFLHEKKFIPNVFKNQYLQDFITKA